MMIKKFDEDFQIDPELISQSVISERKETLKYLKELKQNEFKNFTQTLQMILKI